MENVVVLKLLVLFLVFPLTLVASCLPVCLARRSLRRKGELQHRKPSRVLSLLNCLAGGVFLGTCLLDLVPSVEEQLQTVVSSFVKFPGFPLAQFVIGAGLLLILSVEQFTAKYNDGQPTTTDRPPDDTTEQDLEMDIFSHEVEHWGLLGDENRSHKTTNLRSWTLAIAISMHSIFEGLAVGLQQNVTDVLELVAAVALHKCVLAFGLGLTLVQSNLGKKSVAGLCLTFAVTAPIGIGIGTLVEHGAQTSHSSVVSGVLQGLATGTLLYVTFLEILARELHGRNDRILKVFLVTTGYAIVCGLMLLDPEAKEPLERCDEGSL
ncbi:PREDICTED: zinc transporter ZIP1-like [Branchiostoma belcheri]|uniref:Zinc transporter ZIP1-like n=1 Tax=Branchiostoma belcheri TaxID=7741 RepID=A0A6P4ZFY3_BRABE|nr:PREDICTED: zinc transporter ZIP1-like [Branchiostoma belcheri]